MEQKDNTLDNQLEILNAIEEVKVNHFFKHKVLQSIKQEQEIKESSTLYVWFTPKLQWAVLALVICINVSVFYYAFNAEEQTSNANNIEGFAQEYNLQTSTSLLN
jgi:hypothetical protein